MSQLKTGVTTGACAAAAAKGALLALKGQEVSEQIEIKNLENNPILVECLRVDKSSETAFCWVLKDGGDDPDVTHGLEIGVEAKLSDGDQIVILGGQGVGTVTKPGLQVDVGEPAINPVPQEMIKKAALEVLPKGQGAILTVIVPEGEKVAEKTLNPRLGIVGGISILGTTGIVRPMSEDAYRVSLVPQLTMAKAHGFDKIVLTPGGMGEKQAINLYGFPQLAIAQMSNFVGYMLQACVEQGIKKVILFGHHSKLLKVAGGSFHTHNKVSDGRLETLACFAGIAGASREAMVQILQSNTSEEALDVIRENQLEQVLHKLAERASKKAESYVFNQLEVGTILVDLKGNIIGFDKKAKLIGGELGWRMP